MHLCLKRWIAGEQHHDGRDPQWSASGDILNYLGLPVGISVWNRVHNCRDYLVARDSPVCDRVTKALGDRSKFLVDRIEKVIAGVQQLAFRSRRYHHVVNRIYEQNRFLAGVGARPIYGVGSEYGAVDPHVLTFLLYSAPRFEYIVYSAHVTDKKTLDSGGSAFHWFGPDFEHWWGARDDHEFTLFRIGAVAAQTFTVETPLRTGTFPRFHGYGCDAEADASGLLAEF